MKTIDCTPTWAGLMPGLIAVVTGGEGKKNRDYTWSEIVRIVSVVEPTANLQQIKTGLLSSDADTYNNAVAILKAIARKADEYNAEAKKGGKS